MEQSPETHEISRALSSWQPLRSLSLRDRLVDPDHLSGLFRDDFAAPSAAAFPKVETKKESKQDKRKKKSKKIKAKKKSKKVNKKSVVRRRGEKPDVHHFLEWFHPCDECHN